MTMKFLCLNVNSDYNFGMGGVDISDQICLWLLAAEL